VDAGRRGVGSTDAHAPVGTPPGDGYQLSVGFYNPDAGTALPA
jgi:hypothetical protein